MTTYQSMGPLREHQYKEKHVGGVTLKDVDSHIWVKEFAKYLKNTGKLPVPKWADMVKTATFKELPPQDQDWFYVRTAAVLRRIYIRQGTGCGALRKVYGGRVNRGCAPGHHKKASSSVIRGAMKALLDMKLISNHPDGGRVITSAGRRDADRIASQVMANITAANVPAAVVEARRERSVTISTSPARTPMRGSVPCRRCSCPLKPSSCVQSSSQRAWKATPCTTRS